MDLIFNKYNIPVPRYTSYPTVPYWDEKPFLEEDWKKRVSESYVKYSSAGISLYIHLPFCESLCTYCGCNTRITVNHKVEDPYINAILKEWRLYLNVFSGKPKIKEIHLGGGTPTFFSAENLNRLISGITENAILANHHVFSFEGHPANTTEKHLETLYNLGFKRLSLGIQDFNEQVQKIINRHQTYNDVESCVKNSRRIGYDSVNFDVIYGLPLQTQDSIAQTMDSVIKLKPDRIAFYSYAHVPWMKPGQRMYDEKDLPTGKEKRLLYEIGKEKLIAGGYNEIGMDHFALPNDELFVSMKEKKLHRNFMGYTPNKGGLLVGLGVSSISDSQTAFAQNEKVVETYYAKIEQGIFPIIKGHMLTDVDKTLRQHILNIMCNKETDGINSIAHDQNKIFERLKELQTDGLIEIDNDKLRVTDIGNQFLRNICLAFDTRYWSKAKDKNMFSYN